MQGIRTLAPEFCVGRKLNYVPRFPAGIWLLGRDMAAKADEATGIAILEILEAETGDQQRYCLVQDIASMLSICNSDVADEIDTTEVLSDIVDHIDLDNIREAVIERCDMDEVADRVVLNLHQLFKIISKFMKG